MIDSVHESINSYISEVRETLAKLPADGIARIVRMLDEARLKGKEVFIFGNGGSAATASHFACDLAKGTICEGKPRIKAFALNDNVPLISAWANDSAYEKIFAEPLENYIERGDIAIAISGSGNSPNVLNGVKAARRKGAITIGITGFEGGKLKELVDVAVVVPSNSMEQIEDIHLLIEHIVATCLRKETREDAKVEKTNLLSKFEVSRLSQQTVKR
jgi:D-sedoheptulose 7-phosphate isomerase